VALNLSFSITYSYQELVTGMKYGGSIVRRVYRRLGDRRSANLDEIVTCDQEAGSAVGHVVHIVLRLSV